jgi:uncharacterized membrane protein SpoIIM required for sporulation
MTPDELITQRKPVWERLTTILQSIERRGLSALSEAELTQLGELYRSLTADLALAQRDFPQHSLTLYLNQLVGRTHPLIYHGETFAPRRLFEYYARDLPRLYRELAPFIGAAALLLFGTALISYAVVLVNPDAATFVLPPQTISTIESGTAWWKDLNGINAMGSTFVMTNNLRVAFFSFAGGMLAGLVTLYTLVSNGLALGMTMGLMQVFGYAAPLWEFVVGHGVLELSEITMAGGSGLLIGYAILQPGLLSRKDALVVATNKSVRLLLATAPLLVVAGTIEGMISPSNAPAALKYAIGITSGILLYGYLLLGGRDLRGHTARIRRRVSAMFRSL